MAAPSQNGESAGEMGMFRFGWAAGCSYGWEGDFRVRSLSNLSVSFVVCLTSAKLVLGAAAADAEEGCCIKGDVTAKGGQRWTTAERR